MFRNTLLNSFRHINHQFLVVLTMLVGAVLTSCNMMHEDIAETKVGDTMVLRLLLGAGNTTRAGDNPTGGETGDGLRNAYCHENDIEDLVLFMYNHTDGINAPAGTSVTKLTFIPHVGFHPNTTDEKSVEIWLKDLKYRHTANDQFIAVCNAGNIGAQSMTLGELRDLCALQPWKPSANGIKRDYTLFVMSNANNSAYESNHQGTEADPNVINIDVERLAARIDFCTDGSTKDGDQLKYSAIFEEKNVGNVYLTHIRAFNVMQCLNAPYLIKRLSLNGTDNNYLADEVKPATSYVFEPRTLSKGDVSADQINDWFRETAFNNVSDAPKNWFDEPHKVHVGTGTGFEDGVSLDAEDSSDPQYFYVLDYANENTMLPEATTNKTVTGIAMRAVYQPSKVYSDKNLTEDAEYTKGKTFWRVSDGATAKEFSSLEAAQAYNNEHPELHAAIVEYQDAICYYTVFLRHDNSAKTPHPFIDKMEYGIVRNNIYRLKVSFTGPGIIDIDTDPTGFVPYIYVRKWYRIDHPQINL